MDQGWVMHSGMKCPVDLDAKVAYDTCWTDTAGVEHVSHVHVPVAASYVNWGDKGYQAIGRINRYKVVG